MTVTLDSRFLGNDRIDIIICRSNKVSYRPKGDVFYFTLPTKISRYTRNDNSTQKFPNYGTKYVTEFVNQCPQAIRLKSLASTTMAPCS